MWTEWEVGICSKTCGGGERSKIRDVKIEAAYGGKECQDSSSMTETCNTNDCPGKYFFTFTSI